MYVCIIQSTIARMVAAHVGCRTASGAIARARYHAGYAPVCPDYARTASDALNKKSAGGSAGGSAASCSNVCSGCAGRAPIGAMRSTLGMVPKRPRSTGILGQPECAEVCQFVVFVVIDRNEYRYMYPDSESCLLSLSLLVIC